MKGSFAGQDKHDAHAICLTCRKHHLIARGEQMDGQAWMNWLTRHPSKNGCRTLVAYDDAKLLASLSENADVKTAYASSADYTISLASLGSDSQLDAGQESTAVANTSNKYLDELIGGKIRVGTTPTANTVIECWAYGSVKDTPTYPDALDGTDSAETWTSREILQASLHLLGVLAVPVATSDLDYWLRPTSLKDSMRLSDGLPTHHGLFVTHNTAVALNSTAGNHVLSHTPVFATVT